LKKKYLFFKEWINSGIFFVNDIIDNNGKITQEFILHIFTMLLTELSVFKMSIQFFGNAFLRILNSDIQLDLFFNL
jgi:hypothetical protein